MQDFGYQKETFNLSESLRYELSIQAGLDGFLFLVKYQDEIILLRHHRFSFPNENLMLRRARDIFNEQEFTGRTFLKSEIIISSPGFTLIPHPLFSEKLANRLLAGDTPAIPACETILMPFEFLNATLAFPVSASFLHYFREIVPESVINHEVSFLLQNFFRLKSPALFIHLHDSWFYALSFSEGGPGFLNTFEYRSPDDFLYYYLSLTSLPELKGIPVWFSGNITEDHACFNLARKYTGHADIFRMVRDSVPAADSMKIAVHRLPGITLI